VRFHNAVSVSVTFCNACTIGTPALAMTNLLAKPLLLSGRTCQAFDGSVTFVLQYPVVDVLFYKVLEACDLLIRSCEFCMLIR